MITQGLLLTPSDQKPGILGNRTAPTSRITWPNMLIMMLGSPGLEELKQARSLTQAEEIGLAVYNFIQLERILMIF